MKRENRLYFALHVLAHLAVSGRRPTTSESLASHLGTNPVVVRRSLAGLREAGIVASAKGVGGGWTLARSPSDISLGDVYVASGERLHLHPSPTSHPEGCQIEAIVHSALDDAYVDIELAFKKRLDAITLAEMISGLKSIGNASELPH